MSTGLFGTITRKIEQWTELDVEYYVKNNLYLIIAQIVILLSGLATSVVLARLLTREAYGQYNYVFSIISILAISSLSGMWAAIMHAAANNHDRVLITGTWTRVKWSLAGAAACLGVGLYYYINAETLLAVTFMAAALFFPWYTSFDTFYAFLSGRKRFDAASRYRSGYWIILTLAVVLAAYLSRNVFWVVIVYLAVAAALHTLFLYATIRTGRLNRSEDKSAITYGKQLTGIRAIGIVAAQADKVIVGLALGFSDLAIYAIATMIANLPGILLGTVSQTIFPKIASMDERTAYNEVKKRLPWISVGMILLCGIGALLAPYVIPWLYSGKYANSVFYTQLLFIPVILGAPATILHKGVLQARRQTRKLLTLNLAVSLFELAAMVILALQLGIVGLVIARSAARAFDSLYSWWLTK